MEVEKLPLAEGEIKAYRRRFVQTDRSVAAVHDAGGTGDHILLGEHTVQEFDLKTACFVGKRDAERPAFVSTVKCGGKPLQRVFSGPDLVAHIAQIRAALSACCFGVQGAQAKVAAVCAAVFLRHGIQ